MVFKSEKNEDFRGNNIINFHKFLSLGPGYYDPQTDGF